MYSKLVDRDRWCAIGRCGGVDSICEDALGRLLLVLCPLCIHITCKCKTYQGQWIMATNSACTHIFFCLLQFSFDSIKKWIISVRDLHVMCQRCFALKFLKHSTLSDKQKSKSKYHKYWTTKNSIFISAWIEYIVLQALSIYILNRNKQGCSKLISEK